MLKVDDDTPKHFAANANKGTSRKPAARTAASKARSPEAA
jgi:DNA end-binding protein Ku